MNIITSKTKSRRFKPHYNNAMGKYYHTSRDYVSDMKKNGMEPYNPSDVKPRLSSNKKYEPSEWARKMTHVGIQQVKEHGRTSGSFNAEIAKHLKTEVPSRIARQTEGGTYTE
jgi:hypothetical protein